MKQQLKIDFCDFWGGFNKEDNLFINLLKDRFEVTIDSNPDVLIFSVYDFMHIKYKCPKIFYTAENVRPDFRECDFALSFDYESYGGKNLRLPLYRWRSDLELFTQPKNIDQIIHEKKKFCCMLISNPKGKERNLFFEKLSTYKKIDSGGSYKNNLGGIRVKDKMSFIKEYKFVFAFENASFPGYTTEKIVEPMAVNSIPIYWGSPLIGREFNTRSFINVSDYANFNDAIQQIIAIDESEELYRKYLHQPYFTNNIFPEWLEMEYLSYKLSNAVDDIMHRQSVTSRSLNRAYANIKKITLQSVHTINRLTESAKNRITAKN